MNERKRKTIELNGKKREILQRKRMQEVKKNNRTGEKTWPKVFTIVCVCVSERAFSSFRSSYSSLSLSLSVCSEVSSFASENLYIVENPILFAFFYKLWFVCACFFPWLCAQTITIGKRKRLPLQTRCVELIMCIQNCVFNYMPSFLLAFFKISRHCVCMWFVGDILCALFSLLFQFEHTERKKKKQKSKHTKRWRKRNVNECIAMEKERKEKGYKEFKTVNL